MLRLLLPLTILLSLSVSTGTVAQQRVEGPVEAALTEPAAYAGPDGRQAIRGPWVVALDAGNSGTQKGWPMGAFSGQRRDLPYSPNARQLTGRAGQIGYRGSIAWYRTQVRVPADGQYAIRFESVHHNATVWLDGKEVAGHTGVYLPFEARVPLTAGQAHTLVVRANYQGPTRQKRSGWHRTWFNFGGINREVTIRPLGASELATPQIRTRLAGDGTAVVDVAVHAKNLAPEARALQPAGTLKREGQSIPLTFTPVPMAPGRVRVFKTTVRVPAPALWGPGTPNLYDLDLQVPGESSYRQRIGLRELTWRGQAMRLNGKRLKLHGASLHEDVKGRGDALTPADMDGLVADLQAMGANATRSQHQLQPALLERLDAAGILVWMGLGPVDSPGSWTSKTRTQAKTARSRVRRTYFQTQAHPSIIVWNLANEVAGKGHPDGQIPFMVTMTRELKRRDPGRMVALDVWGAHPPRTKGARGRMYAGLDAIAVTNYAGWYEKPLGSRAEVARLIASTTAGFERVFDDKVLVISEFGAEGNTLNPSGRPGGFAFQERFLRAHIDHYRSRRGISGQLIWNLRDFGVAPTFAGGSISKLVPGIRLVRGVNQKGLFDFEGRPKPAVAMVRRIYGPMGTGLTP